MSPGSALTHGFTPILHTVIRTIHLQDIPFSAEIRIYLDLYDKELRNITELTYYDLGEPTRTRPVGIALGILVAIVIGAAVAWAPWKVAFILLAIIFGLLPFLSLELGFYGMVLLLPLPEARLAIGDAFTVSFSSLMMIGILLYLLSRRIIHREAVLGFEPRKLWPLWAFVLANFASIAVSANISRSTGIFLHLVIWVLLLLITKQVIVNRRILRNVLLLMVAEGLVITLIGYYDNFVNRVQISTLYHYTGGVASIYANRNSYGHYLITIIPLAIAFTIYSRSGLIRLFNASAATSLILSLLFTFSRGAWLGCVIGLSVFMRNWRAWVLAIVAILSIYWWTPENIKMRFRSIWDPRIKSANQSRMLIQASGALLFLKNPILGAGTGTFGVAVEGTRVSTLLPTKLNAHNTYLEMAAETGIIGFIAFICLIVFVTRNLTRIHIPPEMGPDRLYKLALLSAWLSILVHFVVITAFFNSFPWFLIGVILAANRILSTEEDKLPDRIS